MFQPWRLQLREAEEALKSGRLDEASRLLCQGDLKQYFPAKKLLAKAAAAMVARGQGHVQAAESSAGWRDLKAAVDLGAEAVPVSSLRKQLVDLALAEAEQLLAAGNLEACQAAIETLEQRGGAVHEARQLRHVVRKVDQARRLSRRGKLAQADEALAAAIVLRPDLASLHQARSDTQHKLSQYQQLTEQLHRALAAQTWNEAQSLAEGLLAISPECPLAIDARRRAWAAVGMQLADSLPGRRGGGPPGLPSMAQVGRPGGPPPRIWEPVVSQNENPPRPPGKRFLLWIDGVGGYLVCEGEEVVLGQPTPDGQVDVPILGDLSRQHAKIARNGEGYLIYPLRATRIAGKPLPTVTSLADNNLLELGEGVKLRFRRPNPLSVTARLEFVSHHRTQPSSDGVVLMGDSCILGPSSHSHIVCRNWTRQLVIFRQDGQLWCRTSGAVNIDGQRHDGEGPLSRSSQVVGEDFSLSLEEI